MKYIPLVVDPSTRFDREADPENWLKDAFDYAVALREVIRQPINAQMGADFEELRRGIRLLKAIDGKKAGDVLALEDADWEHLCAKLKGNRWTVIDERILRFVESVLNAADAPQEGVSV